MSCCEGVKQFIGDLCCCLCSTYKSVHVPVTSITVEVARQVELTTFQRADRTAKVLGKLQKRVCYMIAPENMPVSTQKTWGISRRQYRPEFNPYPDERLADRINRMRLSLKSYAENQGFTPFDLQVFEIVLEPTSHWNKNVELIRQDVNAHPNESLKHHAFIDFVDLILIPLVKDALADFEKMQEESERKMFASAEEDAAVFRQPAPVFQKELPIVEAYTRELDRILEETPTSLSSLIPQ